jgi:hypothetical protein
MDQFSYQYCSMAFRDRFCNCRGDNFQIFFGQIMNSCYPGDFTQTKPWGNLGDNKCDGFLPSRGKFYQCYAPDEMTKSDTLKKLHVDFKGSIPYYQIHFNTWVFVNNCRESRVPAWLVLELSALHNSPPNIPIENLGFSELRSLALSLEERDLINLFGPIPTLQDILLLRYEDIYPILMEISRSAMPIDSEPIVVSAVAAPTL